MPIKIVRIYAYEYSKNKDVEIVGYFDLNKEHLIKKYDNNQQLNEQPVVDRIRLDIYQIPRGIFS